MALALVTSNDNPEPASEIDDYLAYLERRGCSPGTVRSFEKWLRRAEADVGPLAEVEDPVEMAMMLDTAIGDVASSTRYWRMSVLAGLYRWLMRHGWVNADPTALLDRPRLPRRLPRPIADDDLAAALETADERMRAILLLAAGVGLRCCEIAWLTVDRVLPGHLRVVGKGGHERVVPLRDDVRDALDVYGLGRSGPVIRRGDARLSESVGLSPATISHTGNAHLRSVGSRHTMHSLRHFFATRLYEATGDLALVATLLGHREISTTQGYSRVVVGDRATDAVAGFDLPG